MNRIYRCVAGLLLPLCLAGCAKTNISAPPDTQATVPTTEITSPTTEVTVPTTEITPPTTEVTVPVTVPTETAPPPLTGWVEQDGNRYYYLSDGTLCTGWAEIDGVTHWFDSNGCLSTGWLEENGEKYYLDAQGSPTVGWLELDGSRYYFLENGTMARGKVLLSPTETRYFTFSGKEVILVNPWNFVPEDYTVTLSSYNGWQVSEECLQPLTQMLSDCKDAGHSAVVVSAYRTHEYQIALHQRRIQRFLDQGYSQEDAEREAAKRVAYPGTSEHELGLAVDIVDESYQNLTSQQETMPAQKWLMENCWKYGFILRYPNEKSEVTGIIYEPWHYRYVGTELAAELHDTGLCLEEYLDLLTK